MRRLFVFAITAFACSSQASVLWYNGDLNGTIAIDNSDWHNGQDPETHFVFCDFNVASPGFTIQSVFSNVVGAPGSDAQWSIRSGMSAGNGGTLVGTGFAQMGAGATFLPTGRMLGGQTEFQIRISGLNVVLNAPGDYWLSVKTVSSSQAPNSITETSGANAVGVYPGNNGRTFRFSRIGSVVTRNWEEDGKDYSMGIEGVPEPATMIGLGIGVLALLRKRRRVPRS